MISSGIDFTQHIKHERINIVIKSLMVKKKFRQKAKILAINATIFSIDLEHGEIVAAVNLATRRAACVAFLAVATQRLPTLHILQTKFTNKQLFFATVFFCKKMKKFNEVENQDNTNFSPGNGEKYQVSISN